VRAVVILTNDVINGSHLVFWKFVRKMRVASVFATMRLQWMYATFFTFLLLPYTTYSLSIEYIEGQRCLLAPSQTKGASNPPLIVLPGMAQSIAGWELHVPALSQERDVLIYECIGIGPEVDEGLLDDVSLPVQAEQLLQTIETIFPDATFYHLAGFSLGGRIAMAAACISPKLIAKLHLTGVGAARTDWGRLQLQAWKDHLQNDNLRAFGWAALLASYSRTFLMKSQDKLPLWVEGISKSQTIPGLLALLEQTHEEGDAEWSVESMAKRLSIPAGRLCVGELDQMSPLDQVQRLAELLKWDEPTVVPNVAHVVPSEAARQWRQDLLNFLDGLS